MKYSVLLAPEIADTSDPEWLVEFACRVEELGFDELSVVEHSVVIRNTTSRYPYSADGEYPLPIDCSLPDPLEVLSFVAARTTTLGLSTGVLVLPNQHPVVLAKRIATLDRLSGGRLRISVGLGWMREEIEACGAEFDGRGGRADDAITVMRALWRGTDPAGVDVKTQAYTIAGAHSWPKPLRPTGVPIYIGGHSHAAARRAGRLGDGFQPLGLFGEKLTVALKVMHSAAAEAGRDPEDVDLVLGSTLKRVDDEHVAAAAATGASRLLLAPSRGATERDALLSELADCAHRLGLAR